MRERERERERTVTHTYREARRGCKARIKRGSGGVGDPNFSKLRCYYVQSMTQGVLKVGLGSECRWQRL